MALSKADTVKLRKYFNKKAKASNISLLQSHWDKLWATETLREGKIYINQFIKGQS